MLLEEKYLPGWEFPIYPVIPGGLQWVVDVISMFPIPEVNISFNFMGALKGRFEPRSPTAEDDNHIFVISFEVFKRM